MKITRYRLRRWGACYTDSEIKALVPEAGLTPLEVAELDIPAEDRMWVLLREDIIPARALRLLACGWAEDACRLAGWQDRRILDAIAVARRYAAGEATEAELAAARASTRAVLAEEAETGVANADSHAAMWSTVSDAARAAASAAWASTVLQKIAAWGSAAWSARSAEAERAVEAERAEQLRMVVKLLKG